jgi:pimeloyl-ACP methyl ester carboxylesterase
MTATFESAGTPRHCSHQSDPARGARAIAYGTASTRSHVRLWFVYASHDGIAPGQNSSAIAARIRGAELRGYEGGHLFLFQDPPALLELEAFLQAPVEASR